MHDWLYGIRFIVITVGGGAQGSRHVEIARACVEGGCRAVQLRDKEISDREFVEVARRMKEVLEASGAMLFVNDRVDAAAIVGASGVHLGVSDIRVKDARSLLPGCAVIGYSPESLEDAREAVSQGANYLGVGPLFGTETKEDAGEAIGPGGLSEYARAFSVPVVAVGGITASTVDTAFRAGAHGVAVCSAVCGAPDMIGAVREIARRVYANGEASDE